jgi:hypothetical protein
MKQNSEEFLRRKEAGEKSIFWSSNKAHETWTDYHAQYVEQPHPATLQPDLSNEICLGGASGTAGSRRKAHAGVREMASQRH